MGCDQKIRVEGCLGPDLVFSGVIGHSDAELAVDAVAVFGPRIVQDRDQPAQCGDHVFDVVWGYGLVRLGVGGA